MLFAIDADALYEAITSDNSDVHTNIISHSKIVSSDPVLDLFEKRFSNGVERDLLRNFLATMAGFGRIKFIPHSDSEDDFEHYVDAGYAGGKNFLLNDLNRVSVEQAEILANKGIKAHTKKSITYQGSKIGYEPFEVHTNAHNTRRNPRETLGRFFKGAAFALFYDKFINDKSCSFITEMISHMQDDSEIFVVTSDRCEIDATNIRKKILAGKKQRLQIEIASHQTTNFLHDRYCYIDSHYELHIPRGLDCFGKKPTWNNVNSQVFVYDCFNGKKIEIICRPRAGRNTEKVIELKSSIVA
ncbi:hypothetical protein FHR51_000935 [Xanthomonas arboricola]|uniref:hypothetical protein n=1 Tax=Xanthomonas cannabis TaxID=1885674 RepID=UPI001615D6F7|nr:hypothetical protein [Xanthomonas cannabis]MBB3804824.1 hypothetical protein [Xanthomonas cannabis]